MFDKYKIRDTYTGRGSNVMKKYLLSKVGQPWVDVCKGLTDLVEKHSRESYFIHDILRKNWYVSKTIIFVNGKPSDISWGSYINFYGLYVDPTDGKLKHLQKEKYQRPEPPKDIVKISELESYKLIEGQWYYIRRGELPEYLQKYYNRYFRSEDRRPILEKRQLNKKEIRTKVLPKLV